MFERVLANLIKSRMELAKQKPALLRLWMRAPGWGSDEIEKQAKQWERHAPAVVHNFGKAAGTLPAFAITMAGENEGEQFVGRSETALILPEVEALVAEVEAKVGHQINCDIYAFQYTYAIYVMTDNPDVTLCHYNVLKQMMLGSRKELIRAGLDRVTFTGMDLQNNPQFMPETVYSRVWQVSGYAHVLAATDFDLSPWARRFKSIEGLFVAGAGDDDAGITFTTTVEDL
jgi:hypothetical protein